MTEERVEEAKNHGTIGELFCQHSGKLNLPLLPFVWEYKYEYTNKQTALGFHRHPIEKTDFNM